MFRTFVFSRLWQRSLVCSLLLSAAFSAFADGAPVKVGGIKRQQSYDVQRLFAGRVLGSQRADIGFEVAGRVVRLHVVDGQRVERGQLLAELDTKALEIERGELRAARREVQARIEQLRLDQERFNALAEKGYVSQGQLDELDSRLRATREQLTQVAEQLRGVELRLQKSTLTAPFAGEIASLNIEEGVVVAVGRTVLQLVETGNNEAVFGVSDQLGRDLLPGEGMEIARGDQRWSVTIISVSRNLDWRTQTRTVRVQLPKEAPFVDGETVHLLLHEVRQKPGFWLPMTAMVGDVRGTWAVYQIAEGEEGVHLRKRSVQPLYQFRGNVYVQGELQDGDRVVTDGTHRLVPGEAVTIAKQDTPNAE